MKTLDNFIEKLIEEYQEHFKKGNFTLGTLQSDWEVELFSLVHDLCEKQKMECTENAKLISNTSQDFRFQSCDCVEYVLDNNSILNCKNVCDYE